MEGADKKSRLLDSRELSMHMPALVTEDCDRSIDAGLGLKRFQEAMSFYARRCGQVTKE